MSTTTNGAEAAGVSGGKNGGGAGKEEERMKLAVKVVAGDVRKVQVPVAVAGQYKGVAPVERSAMGAFDAALDSWITDACNRGLLGGDLGELFFIPAFNHNQVAASSILLAGMGEYGKFNYESLCYLAMNVAYGVGGLGYDRYASVLIGSGEGGLPVGEVVKGMLSGVCDALHHLKEDGRAISELVLVEYNPARASEVLQILETIRDNKSVGRLDISVSRGAEDVEPPAPAEPEGARRRPASRAPASQFVNRLTIERGEEGFQFSALTDNAVVPVRRIEVQPYFTDGIADRLQRSGYESQTQYGRLLHTYVFPEEFERLIAAQPFKPLTLVLDHTTAPLPWEMACFDTPERRVNFGLDLRLTRQFRTMLSAAPGIAPPVNDTLRVLVIANPASGDEHLPGAKAEGEQVVAVLERFKRELKGALDLDFEARIGPDNCNPIEVLNLLLSKTYDIVHYSGHGTFDPKRPNRGGWLFDRGTVLSAREIFRARQVPRLVFANACFSSATGGGKNPTGARRPGRKAKGGGSQREYQSAQQTTRKVAGMAEAFFERGVQNYVGAGWKVDDGEAARFAQVFYEQALRGETLSGALTAARRALYDESDTDLHSTWGAYQHYGQSNARLVPEPR